MSGSWQRERLGPAWPTFLDTRAWIFSEALWAEYTAIARAEENAAGADWDAALSAREITVVAVDLPRFHRLAEALAAHPDWEPLLTSQEGVVYAR